jgi:SAM-dependent methyltransferase
VTVGLPDYAQWLSPERLAENDPLWQSDGFYIGYADEVNKLCAEKGLSRVLEIGCGTGFVPQLLNKGIAYTGLDANAGCIRLSKERNPGMKFVLGDIRYTFLGHYDLVCSFAMLKHFALGEWPVIVKRVLKHGSYGLFTMPVGAYDLEDGVQFWHLWVTEKTLDETVRAAGHKILWQKARWSDGKGNEERFVATEEVI